MKTILLLTGLCVPLCGFAAAPKYKAYDVPAECFNDINNNRVLVGYDGCVAFVGEQFVYTQLSGTATGINDANDIVGFDSEPWLWRDEARIGLGEQWRPMDINNSGVIVGYDFTGRAVMLRDGVLTDLGPGVAQSVNRFGIAVGVEYPTRGFLYQDGQAIELPFAAYYARINDAGTIATGPYLYQKGTMSRLAFYAMDINNPGEIVGNGNANVYLYRHGEAIILNSYIEQLPNAHGKHYGCRAMNDLGDIVGIREVRLGRDIVIRTFLLVRQPETPTEQVQELIAWVSRMTDNPKPLTATLSAALSSIQRGNMNAAAGQLRAFQNKARAQVRDIELLRQLTEYSESALSQL